MQMHARRDGNGNQCLRAHRAMVMVLIVIVLLAMRHAAAATSSNPRAPIPLTASSKTQPWHVRLLWAFDVMDNRQRRPRARLESAGADRPAPDPAPAPAIRAGQLLACRSDPHLWQQSLARCR